MIATLTASAERIEAEALQIPNTESPDEMELSSPEEPGVDAFTYMQTFWFGLPIDNAGFELPSDDESVSTLSDEAVYGPFDAVEYGFGDLFSEKTLFDTHNVWIRFGGREGSGIAFPNHKNWYALLEREEE